MSAQNSWVHDWDTPYAELDGKSTQEVAAQGIKCHFSQQAYFVENQGPIFGLLRSQVGMDEKKKDFLRILTSVNGANEGFLSLDKLI